MVRGKRANFKYLRKAYSYFLDTTFNIILFINRYVLRILIYESFKNNDDENSLRYDRAEFAPSASNKFLVIFRNIMDNEAESFQLLERVRKLPKLKKNFQFKLIFKKLEI